jgi:hypothetical protein
MEVIIDEYNLDNYSNVLIINDDASYIEARKLILKFKREGLITKDLVVTTEPYANWFYDIEGESGIFVSRKLPSNVLRKKYPNILIDSDLEESDIVELGLIHEKIEPTEMSIVNKFIGPFLFSDRLIVELYSITNFGSNPSKEFLHSKYLRKKWTKFLSSLENSSIITNCIIKKIKEVDIEFCKILNRLLYYSKLDPMLDEYLRENSPYLKACLNSSISEVEFFLKETEFSVPFNEQYEKSIEYYFRSLYDDDVNAFYEQNGNYLASLKAYLCLTKSISVPEKEFIFSTYADKIDAEIHDKIRSLMRPELLVPPVISGDSLPCQIEKWQKWAIDSFIPFKFYLDENPNNNDISLVEEYANVYSDWLLDNYSDIIQNGLNTNYNITRLIHDELSDFAVIWLIIDGLPAVYTDSLIAILNSHGINNVKNHYNFTMVPTITEIGIPTQLNGKFPNSHFFTNNRIEALNMAFSSKKITFKNSIKHFEDALNSDFDLCCLHWHDIDQLMHKEDVNLDTNRIEEIKRLLNVRIKQIANSIKANSRKKVKLIISTDHGCTKCLNKGLKIKNQTLLDACHDSPKERCVELTGKLSTANLDSSEIYYLNKESTFNVNDWVVAKGYRYFGRFDYGYRHGGLTPEETIVPFLICEIAKNEIIPIKVIFSSSNQLVSGYTETINLQLKNENDAVIDVENIVVLEDERFNVDSIFKIKSNSFKILEGRLKIAKNAIILDGKTRITVVVNCAIFGTKYRFETILDIPISKPINEDLDNLFK